MMGQYFCPDPKIEPETQQPVGCTKDNIALLNCSLAKGLKCSLDSNPDAPDEYSFVKQIPCQWTNGYSYEVTLLLSIFLGMFGVDRF